MKRLIAATLFGIILCLTGCSKRSSSATQTEVQPSFVDSAAQTSVEQKETEPVPMEPVPSFLAGRGTVSIAAGFSESERFFNFHPLADQSYTIEQLIDTLKKDIERDSECQISYSHASLQVPGRNAHAVKLSFVCVADEYTQFLILTEDSGLLHIHFAIDGWSRRYSSISRNGVVFDAGSNGAASHSAQTFVPDSDFTYHLLVQTNEVSRGFEFYDKDNEPSIAINAVMNDVYEKGNVDPEKIYFVQTFLDDKTYYYYDGYGGVPEETSDVIKKIAADYLFTFDSPQIVKDAVLKKAGVYSAQDIYTKDEPLDWSE